MAHFDRIMTEPSFGRCIKELNQITGARDATQLSRIL